MGIFSKEKEIVYPFSGFEGQLLYKGKPAAGAVLTRIYDQMDQGEVKESVKVDEQGRFAFESIILDFEQPVFSAVSYLSRQYLDVDFNGENYEIWTGAKFSKGENSEFGGLPKNLKCEITDDIKRFENGNNTILTNCKWDVE